MIKQDLFVSVFSPRVVGIAVARYNFCSRDMREISLQQGDIIKIYTKMSNGWWKGEVDGRVGLLRDSVQLGRTPTISPLPPSTNRQFQLRKIVNPVSQTFVEF